MPSPQPSLQPGAQLRLALEQLKNGAYHSPDWGDYQLVDGVFYRPPATKDESPQLYSSVLSEAVFGDLNGDGFQDAAVILTTYNGGNGNTKELAVVLDQDGSPANVVTIPVGFQAAVEAVEVKEGDILLQLRVLGPNDGLCCPSQAETHRYRLENGKLVGPIP